MRFQRCNHWGAFWASVITFVVGDIAYSFSICTITRSRPGSKIFARQSFAHNNRRTPVRLFAAVRTLAPGFESTLSNTIKNHAHTGVIIYCGGDEGIRTLDTLAGILHFQCSALDQLCDVSCNRKWHYSSDSAAVSSDSDSGSVTPVNSSAGSSSKAFSNSASISRNCGSSPLAISNDSSSSAIAGVSL